MHSSMRRLSALYKAIVVSIFVITGLLICFISIKAIAAPVDLDIPAQPLSNSLKLVAKATGASVAFDSKVTEGITAPAIKGRMESYEAIRKLLAGTGLEASTEGTTTLIKRSFEPTKDSNALELNIPEVNIRAKRLTEIGPLPGLGLTKNEIPGNVQSISAQQIKDSHSISLSDLMNSQLQSVNVNDYQGNPFQMDVTYRGFTASPQLGTPQGLSVFLDGIRVNEPFGDVVNWDMIPMNALAGMDVFPGSNPIFGLGTLGGALSMRTKNGFDDAGVQTEMLAGAFGRKQFLLSAGGSKGDLAGFVALNLFNEDGWRQNSPSDVNQMFGKLSYRNDALSLDGSLLYAWNNLVGNGLVPIEMYQQNSTNVFSSPDETKNRLIQFQIASAFQVSDTFSITGQVYNRKSDRKSSTGDINTDFASRDLATRRPATNENAVCAFSSTNPYKIPDYYLFTDDGNVVDNNGNPVGIFDILGSGSASAALNAGMLQSSTLNGILPTDYAAAAQQVEANMFNGKGGASSGGYLSADGSQLYDNSFSGTGATWLTLANNLNFYTDPVSGAPVYLVPKDPINPGCGQDSIPYSSNGNPVLTGGEIRAVDSNGNLIVRDGAYSPNGTGTGYVEGTPIAIITDTSINQLVRGGAVQLNWQTDLHKFMVGASLDHATDTYNSAQMLGLFDANRRAYVNASALGAEYSAASTPISNNNFNGSSDTRSLYTSETFSPRDNLHFSFGARYNNTKVMTNMNSRINTASRDISDYQSLYMDYLLCTGLNLGSCDSYLLNNPTLDPRLTDASDNMTPYVKEVFKYRSLNPSFGATWSPNEALNVYANWSQGARTPSTIELGCAFDRTIVTQNYKGVTIPPTYASLVNGSSCTLPGSLSGDPYLKQVKSQTAEIGVRGKFNNGWDWNASIYRTDLKDDIYFVSYNPTTSFFDTVGDTLRQGIEMGFSGKEGKADFRFNYSLTDATFQTTTQIANTSNISVNQNPTSANYGMETISPGNRMPGIPLHNVNARFGYQLTDQWHVGLTMVAHGSAYERGNENNQQHPGTVTYIDTTTSPGNPITVVKNFTSNGRTPGYMTFNFNTTYDFGKGWSGSLIVNNLLDKEYYSAGRLGVNPFSPSINGAIGASGWNYNSNEWLNSNFIAPGAPRAAWISVRYEFDADKK